MVDISIPAAGVEVASDDLGHCRKRAVDCVTKGQQGPLVHIDRPTEPG